MDHDWHTDRCYLSADLIDPATADEILCWTKRLLPTNLNKSDLGNPKGYYKALGCSKISSDNDIASALREATKAS